MISHKYKCIFIHIPKTAGTSIEKKLGLFEELSWGVQDHRTIKDIRPIDLSSLIQILIHNQRGYSRRSLFRKILFSNTSERVSKNQYENYFRFTIVRNPWDRIYSWYRGIMRDPKHGYENCDFKTFVKKYKNHSGLKSQLYWITDFEDKIAVDKIIRFENLASEILDVFNILNMKDFALPHLLDSEKTGKKKDYRGDYDEELFEIVMNTYDEEIRLFDYKFD